MKKTLILLLVLMLSLPPFALAAETTQQTANETEQTETQAPAAQPVWRRGMMQRRFQTTKTAAPGSNFADENEDGLCDTCGKTQAEAGKNFAEKNQDGVCDCAQDGFLGQHSQMTRSMLKKHRNTPEKTQRRIAQGTVPGQGLGKRGFMNQSPVAEDAQPQSFQGSNFADENQDGICDLYQNNGTRQTPAYRNGGPGRNRR